MEHNYLEITYRDGRPIAAYYYLPRRPGDRGVRTQRVDPGLVIDFTEDDRPIGIEITAPGLVSLDDMNRTLRSLGLEAVTAAELAPLHAA